MAGSIFGGHNGRAWFAVGPARPGIVNPGIVNPDFVNLETPMAVEQARARLVPKPWGRTDLRPWNVHHDGGAAIGEVWFERTDAGAPCPALLLKLIFTSAPLSIQVHPDDVFARSIGLAHGKCEAWYVLSACADAQIAVGLKHQLTPAQLRASIGDGSIAAEVQWRAVRPGEATWVPPGTIHAIGAGLVIVEIQQRSDVTFRLFDYGRGREIHVDAAVAAANADRAERQPPLRKLTAARTLVVASPHFVLERLALAPDSAWKLNATAETWLFILSGGARVGADDVQTGSAIFLEADGVRIDVASDGLEGLVAYAGAASTPDLLRRLIGERALDVAQERERAHSPAKAMSVTRPHPGGAAR
jgi:mannose-6-phosphate isomerase